MQKGWKQYLEFSKRERLAVLLLLCILLLIWMLPFLFPVTRQEPKVDWILLDSATQRNSSQHLPNNRYRSKASYSGQAETEYTYPDQHHYSRWRRKYEPNSTGKHDFSGTRPTGRNSIRYFPFDPNTASDRDWITLGIAERQVRTIRNYLNKGGRFRIATDLERVYGLRLEDARRLMPYVRIASAEPLPYSTSGKTGRYSKPPNLSIAINQATTEQWEQLPGIGPKLAERIVKFRDKLGGFSHNQQVSETFGLPDSTFNLILPNLSCDGKVRQISINSVTKEELAAHPYFRGKLPAAIISYREQHGKIMTMEDLSKINLLNGELLAKIRPYLLFE